MSFHKRKGCEIARLLTVVLPVRTSGQANPMFRKLRKICMLALPIGLLFVNTASAAPPKPLQGKDPDAEGVEFVFDAPEADVLGVVRQVAEDPVLRGTYVYEKEKTLTGAQPADSSAYFGRWTEPGQAFYKVVTHAIAPRHFRDSADVGTITVRYVVRALSESRTHLWIEAVFVEEGHRKANVSDGTVEASELKEIQDRLRQIHFANQEAAAAVQKRQEEDDAQAMLQRRLQEEATELETAENSVKNLELRFHELQHQVIVQVKNEGAELKSAPFRSATKVQSLFAGQELVILIVTPSWYGVETSDKHRGWLRQDLVGALP
jgi:hypothetical protein